MAVAGWIPEHLTPGHSHKFKDFVRKNSQPARSQGQQFGSRHAVTGVMQARPAKGLHSASSRPGLHVERNSAWSVDQEGERVAEPAAPWALTRRRLDRCATAQPTMLAFGRFLRGPPAPGRPTSPAPQSQGRRIRGQVALGHLSLPARVRGRKRGIDSCLLGGDQASPDDFRTESMNRARNTPASRKRPCRFFDKVEWRGTVAPGARRQNPRTGQVIAHSPAEPALGRDGVQATDEGRADQAFRGNRRAAVPTAMRGKCGPQLAWVQQPVDPAQEVVARPHSTENLLSETGPAGRCRTHPGAFFAPIESDVQRFRHLPEGFSTALTLCRTFDWKAGYKGLVINSERARR